MKTSSHPHVGVPAGLLATDINGYSDAAHEAKEAFHKDGKTFLASVATALGLSNADYDLRSNKAGVAVSGEVTLHSDHLYLQLSESSIHRGVSLLYRSCSSRKDYTGHQNHFISAQDLRDVDKQCRFLQGLEALMNAERLRRERANSAP